MKIPHSISKNVAEIYKCSFETTRLMFEVDRTIRSEDLFWDDFKVPSLRSLALHVIANSWQRNPLLEELPTCEDKDTLMELLPTDLPLELTIKKIDDEYFWERSSAAKWEHNDPSSHGNSYRQRYCEKVLWEYLENFEPSLFEAQQEDCDKLISLLSDYIYTIELHSLRPTKKRRISLEEEDPCLSEKHETHHIPFQYILPKFPHLTEMRINFGLVYMNDGFEWRDFEISIEDCISLGEGIKQCQSLKKFSLSRSNIDRPRVAALLQGIVENDNVEELDLSHCKLEDNGTHAVGEFLSLHKSLKVLHLANNNIGPDGVSGLIYGLLKREHSVLEVLDLRLNPLKDAGVFHVCAFLLRNKSLEYLDVSACDVGEAGGAALAEVLSSGSMMCETFSLFASDNDFGETVGKSFEAALNQTDFVVGFEARMCNFSSESEQAIYEKVLRHRQERSKEKARVLRSNATNSIPFKIFNRS